MTPMAHMSLSCLSVVAYNLMKMPLLHWLSVSTLVEDLGCHVARRTACRSQHMELLFIHDTA
jgi:hypothetical protein